MKLTGNLTDFQTWKAVISVYAGDELVLVHTNPVNRVFDVGRLTKSTASLNVIKDKPVTVEVNLIGDVNSCALKVAEMLKGKPLPVFNRPEFNLYRQGVSLPVLCSNGQEYCSQSHAAVELNLHQPSISACLKGLRKSVGGLSFWYKNDHFNRKTVIR